MPCQSSVHSARLGVIRPADSGASLLAGVSVVSCFEGKYMSQFTVETLEDMKVTLRSGFALK